MKSPIARVAAVTLAGAALVVLPAASDSDVTAPIITDRDPARSEEGVAVDRSTVITFSEPLDPATVDGDRIRLRDGLERVPATVELSEDGTRVVVDPSEALLAGHRYVGVVVGGEGGVTDLAGNPRPRTVRWPFFTNHAPKIAVISPPPGSITRQREPLIAFRASDAEGRVPRKRVTVTVDDKPRRFDYDAGEGKLSPRLLRGEHTVVVTATDALGVSKVRQWSFRIGRGGA